MIVNHFVLVCTSDDNLYLRFYLQGDLFAVPSSVSLGHCVSRDLKMGAGIAVVFKRDFGRVTELRAQHKKVEALRITSLSIDYSLVQILHILHIQIGDNAILYVGNRFIYYMITKARTHAKILKP